MLCGSGGWFLHPVVCDWWIGESVILNHFPCFYCLFILLIAPDDYLGILISKNLNDREASGLIYMLGILE